MGRRPRALPRARSASPRGTIKATVLIETILAAFEMDEILYELRDHIVGLNCGRWDYIFSFIKKFSRRPDFVLPDREQVTMTTHFLRSYSQLADQDLPPPRRVRDGRHGARRSRSRTTRRRTTRRSRKVRADKEREAGDGHDGTWVAHPGLVPVATRSLRPADAGPEPARPTLREDVEVTRADLLQMPAGHDHRGGPAQQHQRRHAVPRGLARRQRLRADQQPDGRRRDRRDLARADLAVDQASRRHARRRPQGHRRAVPQDRARGAATSSRAQVGAQAYAAGNYERAATLIDRITTAPDFETFLTLAGLRGHQLTRDETLHDEHAAAEQLRKDWQDQPALEGRRARLHGRGRRAAARHRCTSSTRSRAWAPRSCGSYMHEKPFVNALGALTGNQAMQQVTAGLKAIYLSGWQVAADANLAGRDVPGPVAVPGGLACRRSSGASTTRCCAPTRSTTPRATTRSTGCSRSSPTPRPASAAC